MYILASKSSIHSGLHLGHQQSGDLKLKRSLNVTLKELSTSFVFLSQFYCDQSRVPQVLCLQVCCIEIHNGDLGILLAKIK